MDWISIHDRAPSVGAQIVALRNVDGGRNYPIRVEYLGLRRDQHIWRNEYGEICVTYWTAITPGVRIARFLNDATGWLVFVPGIVVLVLVYLITVLLQDARGALRR